MRTNNKGFTVIELLITGAVVIIMLVIIFYPTINAYFSGRSEQTISPSTFGWWGKTILVILPDGHDYFICEGNGTAVVHSAECRKCKVVTPEAPPPPNHIE